MMTPAKSGSPQALLGLLRFRYALGRMTEDSYVAALREAMDELSTQYLATRERLSGLSHRTHFADAMRAHEQAVAACLRALESRDTQAATANSSQAERALLALEEYGDAVDEIAKARRALLDRARELGLILSEHATLRGLLRALDSTGTRLIREGFPGRARMVARLVLREVATLEGPSDRTRCRTCVTLHDATLTSQFEPLPPQYARLRERLACDAATDIAFEKRRRSAKRDAQAIVERATEVRARAEGTRAALASVLPDSPREKGEDPQ
jgi:hypothetical protein